MKGVKEWEISVGRVSNGNIKLEIEIQLIDSGKYILFYLNSFFVLLYDLEFSLEMAAKFYQIASHDP